MLRNEELNNLKEILNFSFSKRDFINNARYVITDTLKHSIEINRRKLEKIYSRYDDFKAPEANINIKELIRRFEKDHNSLSKKELRHLAFNLNFIIKDNDLIKKFLTVIGTKWSQSFFYGLFNTLLFKWNSIANSSKKLLGEFVLLKIQNYNGTNKRIKIFQQRIEFFNYNNGDFLFGKYGAIQDDGFNFTEFLGLPKSFINYEYFSNVILSYTVKSIKNEKVDVPTRISNIIQLLYEHNLKYTSIRTLSEIIIFLDQVYIGDDNNELRQDIKNCTLELIGDPAVEIKWRVDNTYNEEEKNKINQARIILNKWISKELIEIFFRYVINDKRRRAFWLAYVEYISDFKLIGNQATRNQLSSNNNLKNLLGLRYFTTIANNSNVAVLMRIKDKYFIDFSDSGALYVYKTNNNYIKRVLNDTIYNIDELKDTSLPSLFRRNGNYLYDLNEEGRMPHNDGTLKWEEALAGWLHRKLNI